MKLIGSMLVAFILGSWLTPVVAAPVGDVSSVAWVWYDDGAADHCLRGTALINFQKSGHTPDNYTWSDVTAYQHVLKTPCDTQVSKWPRPSYQLLTQTFLYVDGLEGVALCDFMDPKYNGLTDSRARQYRYWQDSSITACATYPDDDFWGIYGGGFIWWNNAWQGAWVFSGWYYGYK